METKFRYENGVEVVQTMTSCRIQAYTQSGDWCWRGPVGVRLGGVPRASSFHLGMCGTSDGHLAFRPLHRKAPSGIEVVQEGAMMMRDRGDLEC